MRKTLISGAVLALATFGMTTPAIAVEYPSTGGTHVQATVLEVYEDNTALVEFVVVDTGWAWYLYDHTNGVWVTDIGNWLEAGEVFRATLDCDTMVGVQDYLMQQSLVADSETLVVNCTPIVTEPDNDFDDDGFTNDEEAAAGSDPNNPLSVPGDINGDGVPDGQEPTPDPTTPGKGKSPVKFVDGKPAGVPGPPDHAKGPKGGR